MDSGGGGKSVSFTDLPGDVLIVEDDPLIALDLEETIQAFGVKSVRSAANVSHALKKISDDAPDFVLLDVGLGREESFAVAEQLQALKISFAFVTGHSSASVFPAQFARRPFLTKPYAQDALLALLKNWQAPD